MAKQLCLFVKSSEQSGIQYVERKFDCSSDYFWSFFEQFLVTLVSAIWCRRCRVHSWWRQKLGLIVTEKCHRKMPPKNATEKCR
jgi:hypothetical protein